MSNDAKLFNFTLINDTLSGKRKIVDKMDSGQGCDFARLSTKFPSIKDAMVGFGTKLTIRLGTDKDTGKPIRTQHPNDCTAYVCRAGQKEVKHTQKVGNLSAVGPATMQTLDLSSLPACKEVVYVGKGDEHLTKPLCEKCRGVGSPKKGGALPTDLLASLGIDLEGLDA